MDTAINRGISKDDIESKLSKLGNTPFKVRNISIDMLEIVNLRSN